MNVARCESSIATSSRTTRASEPRAMTMSLSARERSSASPAGRAGRIRARRAPSAPRRRSGRRRSWPSTGSSSSVSAFDRKPTLPRLMPRIGTSTSATGPDRAQERAVAAEHDAARRSSGAPSQQRSQVARPGRPTGRRRASRHQPAARSRSSTASSLVGLYAKPIRVRRSSARRLGRPGGGDRVVDQPVELRARRPGLQVDEELAVALRALDRRRR